MAEHTQVAQEDVDLSAPVTAGPNAPHPNEDPGPQEPAVEGFLADPEVEAAEIEDNDEPSFIEQKAAEVEERTTTLTSPGSPSMIVAAHHEEEPEWPASDADTPDSPSDAGSDPEPEPETQTSPEPTPSATAASADAPAGDEKRGERSGAKTRPYVLLEEQGVIPVYLLTEAQQKSLAKHAIGGFIPREEHVVARNAEHALTAVYEDTPPADHVTGVVAASADRFTVIEVGIQEEKKYKLTLKRK